MNVELLQDIKAHILAEPDAFRMDTWTCGTAHCIAGWALKLSGIAIANPADPPWLQLTVNGREPARVAAELLSLKTEREEDERLFQLAGWPSRFRSAYRAADERVDLVRIAADRIDEFIATGGVE